MRPIERKALWGIVTLLLGWVFTMQGRLSFLEGRATYFHGSATPEEKAAEKAAEAKQ